MPGAQHRGSPGDAVVGVGADDLPAFALRLLATEAQLVLDRGVALVVGRIAGVERDAVHGLRPPRPLDACDCPLLGGLLLVPVPRPARRGAVDQHEERRPTVLGEHSTLLVPKTCTALRPSSIIARRFPQAICRPMSRANTVSASNRRPTGRGRRWRRRFSRRPAIACTAPRQPPAQRDCDGTDSRRDPACGDRRQSRVDGLMPGRPRSIRLGHIPESERPAAFGDG